MQTQCKHQTNGLLKPADASLRAQFYIEAFMRSTDHPILVTAMEKGNLSLILDERTVSRCFQCVTALRIPIALIWNE